MPWLESVSSKVDDKHILFAVLLTIHSIPCIYDRATVIAVCDGVLAHGYCLEEFPNIATCSRSAAYQRLGNLQPAMVLILHDNQPE